MGAEMQQKEIMNRSSLFLFLSKLKDESLLAYESIIAKTLYFFPRFDICADLYFGL
jgi:hypothetical protein